MDIGTAGHTAFEYDESIIDIYEKNPEYMNCRLGLIHSHQAMGTFFSAEDIEELEDNTINTDFYVSLIVNNASKYTAKIAWRTDEEVVIETTGWFKNKAIKFENKHKNPSLYTIDLDIEIEGVEELITVDARLLEIKEAVKLAQEAKEIAYKAKLTKKPYIPVNAPEKLLSFNEKQLDVFPKHFENDTLGFDNLREIKTLRELDDEIENERTLVMEGEVFDNLLGCLLVLNQQFQGTMLKAMQEVKDKVTPENIPMLVDMINDNLEDYYEYQYGELCTMEAYMELCSAFIRELRRYNFKLFPIAEPLITVLNIELGENYGY